MRCRTRPHTSRKAPPPNWASCVGEVRQGDTVFVTSAAGGVGSLAGQIAKARGAGQVIGSTSSQRKADILRKELGYDAVVLRGAGPIDEQLRAAAPNGLDVVVDNVGGEQLKSAIGLARRGARIVLIGALAGQLGDSAGTEIDPHALIAGSITLRGAALYDHLDVIPEWTDFFARALRDGTLTFPRTVLTGLDQAPRAAGAGGGPAPRGGARGALIRCRRLLGALQRSPSARRSPRTPSSARRPGPGTRPPPPAQPLTHPRRWRSCTVCHFPHHGGGLAWYAWERGRGHLGDPRPSPVSRPGPDRLMAAHVAVPPNVGHLPTAGVARSVHAGARTVRAHHQIGRDGCGIGEPHLACAVFVMPDGGHGPPQVRIIADRFGQQRAQGDAVDVDAGITTEVRPVAEEPAPAAPECVAVVDHHRPRPRRLTPGTRPTTSCPPAASSPTTWSSGRPVVPGRLRPRRARVVGAPRRPAPAPPDNAPLHRARASRRGPRPVQRGEPDDVHGTSGRRDRPTASRSHRPPATPQPPS